MLLVVDVGNSHTVFGIYCGDELWHHWRLQSNRGRTADELGIHIKSLIAGVTGENPRILISAAVVSSVVPSLSGVVDEMCRRYLDVEPLFVGPGIRTGMAVLYERPQDLGTDRLVNAVAAYHRTHQSTIVVDFGTATKVDMVTEKGEFAGGAIAPGIGIAGQALFAHAAKLYSVEFARPPKVVGSNTVHAMQSGLVFGFASLVDGIIKRMMEESKVRSRVLATGGYAALVAPASEFIEEVDEFLTLDGLRIIHERNAAEPVKRVGSRHA